MKTSILTLFALCFISLNAFGQLTGTNKSVSPNDKTIFYEIPVPSELKAGLTGTSNSATTVETVEKDGVTYSVRVTYITARGPEKVVKLEIRSNDTQINKNLKRLEAQSGRPLNLAQCYESSKAHTGDWPALAVCTTNYVQFFIKKLQKN